MAFVIDASIVVAWALAENDAHANATLQRARGEEMRVPVLWWFEVRNALLFNERRGRISGADTSLFLRNLSQFGATIDALPSEADVLALARRHRLTVYDATYLELAQREGIALATLDSDLARAARRERVSLVVELSG